MALERTPNHLSINIQDRHKQLQAASLEPGRYYIIKILLDTD